MNWGDKIFVRSSKNRIKILAALKSEPLSVTDIAKKIDNHRSTVSQQLIRLEKEGFVKCLTPNRANYRVYGITTKGTKYIE